METTPHSMHSIYDEDGLDAMSELGSEIASNHMGEYYYNPFELPDRYPYTPLREAWQLVKHVLTDLLHNDDTTKHDSSPFISVSPADYLVRLGACIVSINAMPRAPSADELKDMLNADLILGTGYEHDYEAPQMEMRKSPVGSPIQASETTTTTLKSTRPSSRDLLSMAIESIRQKSNGSGPLSLNKDTQLHAFTPPMRDSPNDLYDKPLSAPQITPSSTAATIITTISSPDHSARPHGSSNRLQQMPLQIRQMILALVRVLPNPVVKHMDVHQRPMLLLRWVLDNMRLTWQRDVERKRHLVDPKYPLCGLLDLWTQQYLEQCPDVNENIVMQFMMDYVIAELLYSPPCRIWLGIAPEKDQQANGSPSAMGSSLGAALAMPDTLAKHSVLYDPHVLKSLLYIPRNAITSSPFLLAYLVPSDIKTALHTLVERKLLAITHREHVSYLVFCQLDTLIGTDMVSEPINQAIPRAGQKRKAT